MDSEGVAESRVSRKALGAMEMNRTSDNTQSNEGQRLIKQLGNTNWIDRAKAAISLGRIGEPIAVFALIDALNDDHYLVRCHAADALKQIGTPQAIKAVEECQLD